jgi:hypothetical protein
MKNRMQLYSKCTVSMVIVGIMLCFVSPVWAAPQQQQSQESNPAVMTKTDVWIDNFHIRNQSRNCDVTNPGASGCDIYEGDEIRIGVSGMICGCHNRLVWVKFEADAQLIWEGNALFTQKYPSEPVCYLSSVCPESVEFSHNRTWKALVGTHTLKIIMDSKKEILESNENNNTRSVTVTVKHRPLQLPETKPKTPINIPVPTSPAGGQLR